MISIFQEGRRDRIRLERKSVAGVADAGAISRKVRDDTSADDRWNIYDSARMIYFNAKQRQFRKPSTIF